MERNGSQSVQKQIAKVHIYSVIQTSLYIVVFGNGGEVLPSPPCLTSTGLGFATERKDDAKAQGGQSNRRPETETGNPVAGDHGEGARDVIQVSGDSLSLRRDGQRNGSSQGRDGEQFLFVHFFVAAPGSVIATVMPKTFVAGFVRDCNNKLKKYSVNGRQKILARASQISVFVPTGH